MINRSECIRRLNPHGANSVACIFPRMGRVRSTGEVADVLALDDETLLAI